MTLQHTPVEPKKVHPKGKLAAVTRKRNEIEKLLEEPVYVTETLKQHYKDYLQKVEDLYAACTEEYTDWLSTHKQDIEEFRNSLEEIMYPTIKSVTVDNSSYRKPPSIIASDTRSKASTTVSERIKLAQVKAKILAENSARECTLQLEQEELQIKANHDQQLLKLRNEKSRIEAQAQLNEITILEQELDGIDMDKDWSFDGPSLPPSLFQPKQNPFDRRTDAPVSTSEFRGNPLFASKSVFPSNPLFVPNSTSVKYSTLSPKTYEPKTSFASQLQGCIPKTKFAPESSFILESNNPNLKFVSEPSVRKVHIPTDSIFPPNQNFPNIPTFPPTTNVQQDDVNIPKVTPQPDSHNFHSTPLLEQSQAMSKISQVLENQNEISLAMIRNQLTSTLPHKKIQSFDGRDVTKFKPFLLNFQRTIEDICDLDSDKFIYLCQYTEGRANKIVSSCHHYDPSTAYKTAISLLKEEFGNEFKTTSSYIHKLHNWPPIKTENPSELEELSIFLLDCHHYFENMSLVNQLQTPEEIMKIVKKLPYHFRARWRRETYNIINNHGAVRFKDLVQFVKTETKILQQPFFAEIADDCKKFTNYKETPKKAMATVSQESTKSCEFCRKFNHAIVKCRLFENLLPSDRSAFIQKSGLCFACFGKDHISRNCKDRMKCDVCSKSHPTLLHNSIKKPKSLLKPSNEPLQQTTNDNKTSCSSVKIISKRKIQFPIIPVRVSTPNNNKVITINCALDSCSSDCWMTEKLFGKLESDYQNVSMKVSTFEGRGKETKTKIIHDLLLSDLDNNNQLVIERVFTKPPEKWPFTREDLFEYSDISSYSHLADIQFNIIEEDIDLLIGMNIPELLTPLETCTGKPGEPYATKHILGWAVNGPLTKKISPHSVCNFIKSTDLRITEDVKKLFGKDFVDEDDGCLTSQNDDRWKNIVQSSIKKLTNGHYQIDLPLRKETLFPDNKHQILARFRASVKKLKKNEYNFTNYKEFMDMMIQNKFAEEIPDEDLFPENPVWYIPHHPVIHKRKKKLRIVFNCSQSYNGISLNSNLLQGPDLVNNLFGVLLRFREGLVALTGDIEKMFYQVGIPMKHSDLLRFFWIDEETEETKEYRLRVHVFGATSSPSIANFALKQTAKDTKHHSPQACDAILRNFYVDDLLLSLDSEEEMEQSVKAISDIVAEGGFKLTSFSSNSKLVLSGLNGNCELKRELQPEENRALGVVWNTATDKFSFKVNIDNDLLLTKRNLLKTLASLYDPLGLASPAIMEGKKLFQESNKLKVSWDDVLAEDICKRWEKWSLDIVHLEDYEVSRCLKTGAQPVSVELHTFVDGSNHAYGAVSYLKCVYNNSICVSLLSSKSRLTPLNNKTLKTTPRIELCSAKLGVELYRKIFVELTTKIKTTYFWSDSVTVLRYIKNEDKKYQRFVSNKIAYILSHTQSSDWYYVPTKENPADLVSRGLKASKLKSSKLWNEGPKFLSEGSSPAQEFDVELEDYSEVKTYVTKSYPSDSPTDVIMKSVSDWPKLMRRVAAVMKLQQFLKSKVKISTGKKFNLKELKNAERAIIIYVQSNSFPEAFDNLSKGKPVPKSSALRKLHPFVHDNVLRVGGRITRSDASFDVKHPIILHGKSPIVALLVKHTHRILGHMGRETILAYLRKNYYIVKGNALVRKVLKNCMSCVRRQGKPSKELMADLPEERLVADVPAFTNVGIDCFGPFYVTHGRKQEKRYGLIFSCMSTRAIHLEIVHSLSTDSFICALRRFVARRGNVKLITCDNGTNFVSGCRELRESLKDWNKSVTEEWLKQNSIEWKFNPPSGSHFGGFYEREIRSVRKVLVAIMTEQNTRLTDENLSTLMCEVEGILNNRPLTEISSDPHDCEALTPNHLLLLNAGVTLPPGVFDVAKNYFHRRWRQVQYLANLFWTRWRAEYLVLLQQRQKWQMSERSHEIGDLVLIVDNLLPRNEWSLGRIVEIKADTDGKVRRVKISIPKYKNANLKQWGTKEIERPISKLILLRSVNNL